MGAKNEKVILFCDGKKCCKYNDEVVDCLHDLVKENDLKKKVKIKKAKCQGMCKHAPVVCIKKDQCLTKATEKEVKKWFEKHIA